MILKACHWDTASKSTPVYSEEINIDVTLRLFFQDLPPFPGRDKLARYTFYPPFLNFLVISLEHINFFRISLLAKVCENSVFSYFMKNSLLIDSYFVDLASKNHKF